VVEGGVNPGTDRLLDPREIQHHTEGVETVRFQGNDRSTVVAMQVAALASVFQKAMAIAEADFTRHAEHASPD
jgi:hypothetical protein